MMQSAIDQNVVSRRSISPGFNSVGFDPQQPGTSEALWDRAFEYIPIWAPLGGVNMSAGDMDVQPTGVKRYAAKLIVVTPHPDDETFGAGGLIASWLRSGRKVTVISVTDGEASHERWNGLRLIRQSELKTALDVLGGEHSAAIQQIRLSLPDGNVANHGECLYREIGDCIEPGDTLISPFEHDGHPDHDFTGRTCCLLATDMNVPIARYPIWAWHRLTPLALQHLNWGRFNLDQHAQNDKERAIQCYASQLRPPWGQPIIPQHVLEYFRRSFEAFVL